MMLIKWVSFVDAEEASYMLEDLSGLKDIITVDKDNFFKALNNENNGQVTPSELRDFHHGTIMGEEQFQRFAESCGLQHVLSSFFAGVSRARKLFNEKGKDALDKFMNEIDDAKELNIEYYMWSKVFGRNWTSTKSDTWTMPQ